MASLGSTPVGDTFDFGFDYPDEGYSREFTAQEILTIQDGYLVEQLKLITDKRASKESKRDAMEWLMVPLVSKEQTSELAVLSFQLCCYAYGADPAEVQEQMMRIVAPQLLKEYGYE
jgi:hypothetical protein